MDLDRLGPAQPGQCLGVGTDLQCRGTLSGHRRLCIDGFVDEAPIKSAPRTTVLTSGDDEEVGQPQEVAGVERRLVDDVVLVKHRRFSRLPSGCKVDCSPMLYLGQFEDPEIP